MGETIRNIKYVLLGRAITLFLAFLINILLVRLLSIKEFGLYSLAIAFASIVQTLSDFGFGEATMFYVAKHSKNPKNLREYLSVGLFSGLSLTIFAGIVVFALSPVLAGLYGISVNTFRVISVLLVAVTGFVTSLQLLESLNKFGTRTIVYVAMTIARFSSVILVLLGLLGIGAIFGEVLANAIAVLITVIAIRKLISFKFSKKAFFDLVYYAKRIVLATFFTMLLMHGVSLVLGYFSLEELGSFSAAAKLIILVSMFTDNVVIVLFPKVVSLRKNLSELNSQLFEFVRYNIIVPVFFGGMMIILSKELLTFFYGQKLEQAYLMLIILVLSTIINSVFISFYKVVTGLNRPEFWTRSLFVKAFITIVTAFVLIPSFGGVGASFAMLIGYSSGNIMLFKYARKLTGFRFPLRTAINVSLSIILSMVVVNLLKTYFSGLLLLVVSGFVSLTYFGLLIILKEVGRKDVIFVRKFIGF